MKKKDVGILVHSKGFYSVFSVLVIETFFNGDYNEHESLNESYSILSIKFLLHAITSSQYNTVWRLKKWKNCVEIVIDIFAVASHTKYNNIWTRYFNGPLH